MSSRSTPSTDWLMVSQRLITINAARQLSDADQAFVRHISGELMKQNADVSSEVDFEIPLLLAEIRAKFALGDPLTLLYRARAGLTAKRSAQSIIQRLARYFLACNLPWAATALLTRSDCSLDGDGQQTLRQAELALRIIREDAAYAAGPLYNTE